MGPQVDTVGTFLWVVVVVAAGRCVVVVGIMQCMRVLLVVVMHIAIFHQVSFELRSGCE